jgi:hypothetical protein
MDCISPVSLSPRGFPNRETSLVPCRDPRGELGAPPSFSPRKIYLSALKELETKGAEKWYRQKRVIV